MDAFEAVSLPEPLSSTRKKYFSVAEANRALTLVRRVVSDVVRDYKRLCELHAACRDLDAGGDAVKAEKARQKYAAITDRLSELNEELEKIGCELKDYQIGLVAFPARRGGHEVCLSWKLGEEKVAYWHEIGASHADRRPTTEEWAPPR